MINQHASSTTIKKSQFVTNEALVHGGAMFTDDAASQFGKTAPVTQECFFTIIRIPSMAEPSQITISILR